jgi:leucyl aminopeptidase
VATLSLSAKDSSSVKADALVVAIGRGPSGPQLLAAELSAPLRSMLESCLAPLGVTGAADSVHRVPSAGLAAAPIIVLTGVGPLPTSGAATSGAAGSVGPVTDEAVRRAAGAAARSLTAHKSVAFTVPEQSVSTVAAVAEGALMGAYAFTRYRSAAAAAEKQALAAVIVLSGTARGNELRTATRRAELLASAVRATRDLINTPPVDLYPAAFAQAATEAVEGLPVTVTVLDEKKLARGGYGGLLGVGMGSSRPPRLVRLDYAPAGASVHVALIGKGITFDSGGLSIKPSSGMETMKSDMSGAAAVLHAVATIARLGLGVHVSGWLALAENMPSGTAQRPSDVLTVRGGTTVEVLNTDAEGRLVLADAIVAASETNPDLIVDVATLTGAQMVALGNRVSAIMANDDDLRGRIHRAAEAVGEQFWPMPLPPELRKSMDSAVADIANMGDRYGGMLVAGLFLAECVGTKKGADGGSNGGTSGGVDGGSRIPWAHLDIAGPSFNSGTAFGYTPVGGTGVAVRTLLGLVEDVAAHGA